MDFVFVLDLGQWIVISLSVFLFIWYFTANSINRRKGIAIYRWLYRSLKTVGKVSDAEWIGASNMGARLTVKKAANPFRHVEARYLLEPREFLPYWLYSRIRGKRDEVVIQVSLRTAPKTNMEISNRESEYQSKNPLTGNQASQSINNLDAYPGEIQLRNVLEKFLNENGPTVEKITVSREAPHLTIHARIKSLLESPAESYFITLLSQNQDQ